MPVVECDVDDARERLDAAGASFSEGNSEYERWHADLGDAHAVAYDDKLVVQGGTPTDITAVVEPDRGGRVHAYFDGASRGNPGPAAVGWVLVSGDGIVAEGSERIGRATNNQAEYEALLAVLEAAAEFGFDEIEIRGDSQLVEKQVKGAWDTNDPELREKRVRARELLGRFEDWSLTHVPREVNDRADELANEALDDD
ncbi:ribonuclease H, type 1 [Halobacterium hubeiense]|jgi:ribonuclease HI|uniref:Ribonuclease H, type 1 n=1 Tax=Halobacterium hubeiense TaxID=1407499 RepID=A0A0U5GZQ3_9EURY|nr:ribonuclease HI [Halobacterium hubeiense]CQH48399.1 ribonuclease H, type 1 [Halobacterium hubeiense]